MLAVTRSQRNLLIAAGVVLFHVGVLWGLQTGLLRRAVEVVVPVEVLSELITPPAPQPSAPPMAAPTPPQPVQPRKAAPPPPAPARRPLPPAKPAPSLRPPEAEPALSEAPAAAPAAPEAAASPPPPAAGPAAPAAPAAAEGGRIELPSTSADYLRNPPPVYPPMSKRLGEQGKVVVRVLIGADGVPQRAELKSSSGFNRLDQSALEYVMKCRYRPGKVGGVPQAMWYDAPVNFVLE